MGSCLCLLSEVSHDHAILTTSTLTEEKKNDLDFEQSLLSDKVRCANQKKKIAQIKIDVSKPLGKVTLEKYFSCPSLLEFRTVCFHQFVFPLVFFLTRATDFAKKQGLFVVCLETYFVQEQPGRRRIFFWGGGRSHGFQGERARISNRQMSTVNTGNCI